MGNTILIVFFGAMAFTVATILANKPAGWIGQAMDP